VQLAASARPPDPAMAHEEFRRRHAASKPPGRASSTTPSRSSTSVRALDPSRRSAAPWRISRAPRGPYFPPRRGIQYRNPRPAAVVVSSSSSGMSSQALLDEIRLTASKESTTPIAGPAPPACWSARRVVDVQQGDGGRANGGRRWRRLPMGVDAGRFCRRQGLNKGTLQWWRWRLRGAEQQAASQG
jgi:hypothetical protein